MAPRWLRKCFGLENLFKAEPPLRKCFGLESLHKAEPPSLVRPLTQLDIDTELEQLPALLQPWEASGGVAIESLQEAARNKGRVDLVRGIAPGFAAVKRMPNTWVLQGPADFERRRPDSSEQPWVDICLLRLLAERQYPYASRLYGIFRSEQETFVATAFCPDGDMFEFLRSGSLAPPGPKREEELRPLVAQVADAVRWLHDLGVAHRDISMENMLISRCGRDLQVKLIDFGMATLRRKVRGEVRGKDSYRAPEVHSGLTVDTFLVDIFAVGVVLFSLAAQGYPWEQTDADRCGHFKDAEAFGVRSFVRQHRLRSGNGKLMGDAFSGDLLDLISSLLAFRPKARACLGEAAFHEEAGRGERKSIIDMPYLKDTGRFLPRKLGGVARACSDTGVPYSSSSASTIGSGSTWSTIAPSLVSWVSRR